MRDIEGYVLVAGTNLCEFLFGKPINFSDRCYENIESNGINPFETIQQAKRAAKNLSKISEILKINLGELSLKIAETKEEIYFFEDKSNLVVIKKEYDEKYKADIFFGPAFSEEIGRTAYPIPGAFLKQNGYIPYKRVNGINKSPFERALYQLREINRQGGDSATIAQFNLKRLVEFFRR